MVSSRLLVLLALLACLMAATFARADDSNDFDDAAPADDEEAEDDYVPEAKDSSTQFVDSRIVFAGQENSAHLKFPAGENVSTYVSFKNKVGGAPSEVFIVAAHINQIGNSEAYVQNFTGVRSPRSVKGGETVTVKFDFRPDQLLEPQDYNLVVRVFFLDETNTTSVSVAYNNTITITDPVGTDPKTVLTYLIITALIGGAVYYFSSNNILAALNKKSATKKVESSVITDDKTYNKSYVSDEHHKFREQIIKDAAQRGGSPKVNRKASPSPKKKN
eukprot:GILI01006118.1.p1 GENE.GILI01006118.1~~GILI01006118.1.p1  ORF type:complete len:275 (-),score=112.47 GILI01006118.1:240-1064(-)